MAAANPRSTRSKSGCRTCRSRKVKCDESRPLCSMFVRLHLACEYTPAGVTVVRLHDRRVGAGPIKKRQYTNWRPPQLAAAPPAPAASGSLSTAESLPSPCMQMEQAAHMPPVLSTFGFASGLLSGPFQADLFACNPTSPATCAPVTPLPTQDDFMYMPTFPQDDCLAVTSAASPMSDFPSSTMDTGFLLSGDMSMAYAMNSVDNDDPNTASAAPTFISTPTSITPQHFPLSFRLGSTAIVLSSFASRARLTEQDYHALYLFHNEVGFSVGSKSPMWSTHAILIKLAVHHSAILHFLLAASFSEQHWRRAQPKNAEHLSSDNYDEAARAHYMAGDAALAEMTAAAKLGGDNPLYHVVVVACFWLEYLIHRRRDGRGLLRKRGSSSSNSAVSAVSAVKGYRRWATNGDFSRAMGDHVRVYSLRKSLMGCTDEQDETYDRDARDSRDSTPESDFPSHQLHPQNQNQNQNQNLQLPPQMYRSFLSRLLSWLYWYDSTACFFGQGGQLAKQFQRSAGSCSRGGQTLLHVPLYKHKYKSHVDSFYETARTTLFDFWQGNYTPTEMADDDANWPTLKLINETWVVVHALNLLEEDDPRPMIYKLDKLDLIVRNTRELRVRHSTVFWLSQKSEEGRHSTAGKDKMTKERFWSRQLTMADWAVCHQLALELHVLRAGGPADMLPPKAETVAQIIRFAERAIRSEGPVELDRFQWSLFWAGTATDNAVYRNIVMKNMINANFRAALEAVYARPDRETMSLAELRAICRSVACDY